MDAVSIQVAGISTLTRSQAHAMIDSVMDSLSTLDGDYSGLADLATEWGCFFSGCIDPHGLAQELHEHVDSCACEDDDRIPRPTDPTGLSAPEELLGVLS